MPFEANGEVCGCPEFWGVGGPLGLDGQQLPGSYCSYQPGPLQATSPSSDPSLPSPLPITVTEISSSPSELPEDKPSSPQTPADTSPRIPQTNISSSLWPSAIPRHDLYFRSRTPSGPPKETCFFWYHGECRRGKDCDRAHETHITWPVPPPPKFVHWKPCHLSLCPMKEGMEELMKGILDSGDGRIGPDTLGIDVVDADTRVPTRVNKNEQSSVNAVERKDGGNLPSNYFRGDFINDSFITGDEADVISLSSGSCSSTLTSPSPPPLGPTHAPWQASRLIAEESKINTISHEGTHKRLRLNKSRVGPLAHEVVPCPLPLQLATTDHENSTAEQLPSFSHEPPKGPKVSDEPTSVGKKVCFFWYHQGYCRPKTNRSCPWLHSSPTGATEVTMPNGLQYHYNCALPLCQMRSLFKIEQERSSESKEYLVRDVDTLATSRHSRSSNVALDNTILEAPTGPSIKNKICFFWYHQGYCHPRNGSSCPCLHRLDTTAREVSLPDNLKSHNLSCDLPLCPIRLRHGSGHEVRYADKEKREVVKGVSVSTMPKATHVPQHPISTTVEQSSVDLGRKALDKVRKQYANQSNHLLQRYGSWHATPLSHLQPLQKLEDLISQWTQQLQTPVTRDDLKCTAIELGNTIEEQRMLQTQQRKGRKAHRKKPSTYTPLVPSTSTAAQHSMVENSSTTHAQMDTRPEEPSAMSTQLLKPIAHPRMMQKAENPNLIPLSRKRKASVSETQSSTRETKRTQSSDFPVVEERDHTCRNPVLMPDFLGKSTFHPMHQVEVKKVRSGVLVDYVLPSGEDRAEWDTDFLRRAFGEIL